LAREAGNAIDGLLAQLAGFQDQGLTPKAIGYKLRFL
jgi:hypothetical protein